MLRAVVRQLNLHLGEQNKHIFPSFVIIKLFIITFHHNLSVFELRRTMRQQWSHKCSAVRRTFLEMLVDELETDTVVTILLLLSSKVHVINEKLVTYSMKSSLDTFLHYFTHYSSQKINEPVIIMYRHTRWTRIIQKLYLTWMVALVKGNSSFCIYSSSYRPPVSLFPFICVFWFCAAFGCFPPVLWVVPILLPYTWSASTSIFQCFLTALSLLSFSPHSFPSPVFLHLSPPAPYPVQVHIQSIRSGEKYTFIINI